MHASISTVRIRVATGAGAAIALLCSLACGIEEKTAPAAPPTQTATDTSGAPVGMKLIPGGKAIIGLNADEIKAINHKENPEWLNLLASSQPRHEEQVEPFYIDQYEVTNRQWKTYLDATGQTPSKDLTIGYWLKGKIPEKHEDRPVVFVSYDDVMGYCRWAHRRLPTEIEWEFAARGPTGNVYPWGATFDVGDKKGGNVAVCDATKFPKGEVRGTMPVGGRTEGASVFGIEDLAGNVWEWTSSRFVAYTGYTDFIMPTKRGKEGEHFSAPFNNMEYVIRGGAFDRGKTLLMSSLRQNAPPQTWYSSLGFRTAKSATPGVDAIKNLIPVIASYNAANDVLDFSSTVAVERDLVDGEGRFVGARGIAFAPTARIPKLKTVLDPSTPITLGVLIVTEPMRDPALAPGAYTVKFHARNPKEKQLYTPDELWVFNGSGHMERAIAAIEQAAKDAVKKAEEDKKKAEADAKKAAKEAKKKKPVKPAKDAKGKDGKDPATPPEGGTGTPPPEGTPPEGEKPPEGAPPAKEEEKPAEPEPAPVISAEGSIQFDKTRNNIVIWNSRGSIVAAHPVTGDIIDSAKPTKLTMAFDKIQEDPKAKTIATDRLTFNFATETELKGRAIAFTFPLSFEPGRIDSATPPKLPESPKPPAAPPAATDSKPDDAAPNNK